MFFKTSKETKRKPASWIRISQREDGAQWWDVCREYRHEGLEWDGSSEMVLAYDVTSLMHQFGLTPRRARELSDLFSDLV